MSRESIKAVLSLVVIVGFVITLLAWSTDRPVRSTWQFRIAGPIIAVGGLALLLPMYLRRDRAPDYLFAAAGRYFDCEGLCFAIRAANDAGRCAIEVVFQNRFERPCRGSVALRPARGFFMTRAKIEAVGCDIECGPGAFGVATLYIPVSNALQGTRQKFDVGAFVEYPNGRGTRLRNREGLPVGKISGFGDALGTTMMLAGAAAGMIVFSRPASVTLQMPVDVAAEGPEGSAPDIQTLWVAGDPELPGLGGASGTVSRQNTATSAN